MIDKIVCIGKNYLDHAKELGDAVPEEPIFFFKPPSSLVTRTTAPIPLPVARGSVHHECEIVYRIRRSGSQLDFDAVTLGLDLTLRDVQTELKKKGLPWEASKAFARSAVIGPWIPLQEFKDHLNCPFELRVDGEVRQIGFGRDMRQSPGVLLEKVASMFEICDGDLLFTGTPKGVGPILPGNTLLLSWQDRLSYAVNFV